MNLYIRLLLAVLRGFLKPPMALTDTLQRTLRVWPNDIDINKHMNNGRYMTIADLFMLELCLRAKILIPAFKLGWKPMLGGNLVVYKSNFPCSNSTPPTSVSAASTKTGRTSSTPSSIAPVKWW